MSIKLPICLPVESADVHRLGPCAGRILVRCFVIAHLQASAAGHRFRIQADPGVALLWACTGCCTRLKHLKYTGGDMIRSCSKLLTSLAGGQPVLPQLQSALLGAATANHWTRTATAPTSTFSYPGVIWVADGGDCIAQYAAASAGPLSHQQQEHQLSSGRHPWPGFQVNALHLQQLSPRSKAFAGASLHTAASGMVSPAWAWLAWHLAG